MAGAEIGGAVKNVLAIACGIVEGRGLGENARAALITRGLAEMTRLARARGGRAETMMGLAGLGDLTLTCASRTSRNYSHGVAIGAGTPPDDGAVVEGVPTSAALVRLAGRHDVEMPIAEAVAAILHDRRRHRGGDRAAARQTAPRRGMINGGPGARSTGRGEMAYWLFKSEPGAWSWDDQVKAGTAEWDGVRNHQADNNMKAMKTGDRGFFYHSVNAREIVGVVEIVREHYPDHTDPKGRFGMVDVKALMPVEIAGDARRHQGRARAFRHGAGPPVAALGVPGLGRGMGAALQDGGHRGVSRTVLCPLDEIDDPGGKGFALRRRAAHLRDPPRRGGARATSTPARTRACRSTGGPTCS